MKHEVPPEKPDPKPPMTEVTNNAEFLRDAANPDLYLRLVPDPSGKLYTFTTDFKKWKGEEVEIQL